MAPRPLSYLELDLVAGGLDGNIGNVLAGIGNPSGVLVPNSGIGPISIARVTGIAAGYAGAANTVAASLPQAIAPLGLPSGLGLLPPTA